MRDYFLTLLCTCLKRILNNIYVNINVNFWSFLYICSNFKISHFLCSVGIYYTNAVRNVIVNLLRCIHHFKSNLINNMGHVRILGTEPGITFAWISYLRPGVEIRSGVGPILSVVSVVASGIGRGLVVQSGDWSAGRTGVGREERDLSVGASGIQRRYSGGLSGIDTLFNQSG